MAPSPAPSRDLLESPAFQIELLKSERLRIIGTIGVLGLLFLVVLVRELILQEPGWYRSFAWTVGLVGLAVAYEAVMLALVTQRERRGVPLGDGTWRLNVAAESLFPTLTIVVLTQLPYVGPFPALVAPAVFLYPLIITLSTLRLRPSLSLLAGAIAGGGYLVVVLATFALASPEGAGARAFPLPMYVTSAAFMVVTGVAAAAVAAQIRRHVLHAVHEAQERERLVVHARDTLIFGLAKLAEYRDTDTGTHLERIAEYAALLAGAMADDHDEIDDDWIRTLRVAASLHDIGKVGIPDDVLLKPGRLTGEERAVMERHPAIGHEALLAIRTRHGEDALLVMSEEIAIGHHERWDGTGYPNRVPGPEIPLAARIISVADVYDALTSARVYKPPMTHEKSASIIREGKGTQFDPGVVDAFDAVEARFDAVRARYAEAAAPRDDTEGP